MNKGNALNGYEPPITTVVRISNMESILATGSVTFNSYNSQPSFTDKKGTTGTWKTDEDGGSQNQGIGSDPSSNF